MLELAWNWGSYHKKFYEIDPLDFLTEIFLKTLNNVIFKSVDTFIPLAVLKNAFM